MAMTFVQAASIIQTNPNVNNVALTLTGVGAGNLIVAAITSYQSPGTIVLNSITEGATNLTVTPNSPVTNTGNEESWQAYLLASAGGNLTYTATFSITPTIANQFELIVAEYSWGGATGTFNIDFGSATGNSVNPQSAAATNAANATLIFSGSELSGTSTWNTPVGNFTRRDVTTSNGTVLYDWIGATGASNRCPNATGALSAKDQWTAMGVAFNPPAAAAPISWLSSWPDSILDKRGIVGVN